MEAIDKLEVHPLILLFIAGFVLYATARAIKYVFTALSYFEDENNFPK